MYQQVLRHSLGRNVWRLDVDLVESYGGGGGLMSNPLSETALNVAAADQDNLTRSLMIKMPKTDKPKG